MKGVQGFSQGSRQTIPKAGAATQGCHWRLSLVVAGRVFSILHGQTRSR